MCEGGATLEFTLVGGGVLVGLYEVKLCNIKRGGHKDDSSTPGRTVSHLQLELFALFSADSKSSPTMQKVIDNFFLGGGAEFQTLRGIQFPKQSR